MEFCSDGHYEVCYEVRECPVCHMKDEKDLKIDELKNQIDELEETLNK